MIRLAKQKDFTSILEIFREVQNLHAENEPTIFKFADPINAEEFKILLENKDIKIFVSEQEEKINGFLIGMLIEKSSNLTLPRKMFGVENLAVLKSAQKKHIGTSLMDAAIKFAKQEKCDSINLNVWCFNKNAQAFYKHLGFQDKSIKMQFDL